MASTRLGRVQLRIMQVLWDRKTASARAITDALNQSGPAIAHSTVQTLLRKMEEKGAVGHRTEDRTFIYRPLVDAPSVTRSATRELIERVFGGSAAGLVAYLLKEERIGRAELREIRRLIDKNSVEDPDHDRR
jgi:BlaI family penicillinase repressor